MSLYLEDPWMNLDVLSTMAPYKWALMFKHDPLWWSRFPAFIFMISVIIIIQWLIEFGPAQMSIVVSIHFFRWVSLLLLLFCLLSTSHDAHDIFYHRAVSIVPLEVILILLFPGNSGELPLANNLLLLHERIKLAFFFLFFGHLRINVGVISTWSILIISSEKERCLRQLNIFFILSPIESPSYFPSPWIGEHQPIEISVALVIDWLDLIQF